MEELRAKNSQPFCKRTARKRVVPYQTLGLLIKLTKEKSRYWPMEYERSEKIPPHTHITLYMIKVVNHMIKLKTESLFHIIQKLIPDGPEFKMSKKKLLNFSGKCFFPFWSWQRRAFL